ncbi:hypothetical protein [Cyclobacterium marinum]|uniref:Uncharacterized protein n=1 Tax=Cyclobacterium marinum (strain ATCC 25205 / DSM 745 / LMG 13164 / NCIMB 1802) TaxID=880070 RepID=G0J375_CYCMS|nr:hypothetical protein [Cyclobacterium marinum]AEL24016.1 hypothetical protein Cycma_0234 [Cyclobacterium marinum DSM 745]
MVSNSDASIVYFDESKSPVLFSTKEYNKTKPSKLPPSNEEEMESLPIAEWGKNNDFPKIARKIKENNPDLVNALDWKARALYGGGLKYTIRDRYTKKPIDFDKYSETRKMAYEIDQFKYRNRHYLLNAAIDFYDLLNVFPQIILSEDRQKVTRIAAMEAEDCRYAKRKNGDIPFVYLHPDWEEWSGSAKDKKLQTVTCLDILNTFPEELKEQRGETLKYIFPLSYPTGKNYYQLVHWWSLQTSKWLDFGAMIPEVKASILKNLSLIRYHIEMPDYWMSERYPNWGTMKAAERKKAIEKEFKIINDVLTGASNAGKSVYTMFKTSMGKEYGGWKITAIDDKMKDGALLADSSEVVIKIMSATGIDPSLAGLIPGKGGSSRNGSDKREALNIYMSLVTPHEDIILDPFQYSSWHNGWNNEDWETHWYLGRPYLQTLNEISPSKRDTTPNQNQDADQ